MEESSESKPPLTVGIPLNICHTLRYNQSQAKRTFCLIKWLNLFQFQSSISCKAEKNLFAQHEKGKMEENKMNADKHKKFRATRFGTKLLGIVMAVTMAVGVAAPAAAPTMAGPITRNAVAAVAAPVHAASHLYQVHAIGRYFNPQNLINAYLFGTVPLMIIPGPLQPIALADRMFWTVPLQADALIGIPLRVVTGAQVAHAALWDGIDVALLGTGAALATGAVVLGTPLALGAGAVALGAPVALGATALGAGALGAAALGTTAVVGTGLALGAGALATTAVVGTGAAVATGIIAHNLLNSSGDEQSPTDQTEQNDQNESTDGTQSPENTESAAQISESTQA